MDKDEHYIRKISQKESFCITYTSGWLGCKNLRTKIRVLDIPFASTWRVGKDDSRAKALIIHFMDMGAIGTAVYIINCYPTNAVTEMTI